MNKLLASLIILVVLGLFLSVPASAETGESVCLKKRARVVNGRINLARAVKRFEGECPKNTVPLNSVDSANVESQFETSLDPEFKALLQNGFVVRNKAFVVFREGETTKGVQANCPESSILVGGSCTIPGEDISLSNNFPIYPSSQSRGNDTGWFCNYFTQILPGQTKGREFTATAICLTDPE